MAYRPVVPIGNSFASVRADDVCVRVCVLGCRPVDGSTEKLKSAPLCPSCEQPVLPQVRWRAAQVAAGVPRNQRCRGRTPRLCSLMRSTTRIRTTNGTARSGGSSVRTRSYLSGRLSRSESHMMYAAWPSRARRVAAAWCLAAGTHTHTHSSLTRVFVRRPQALDIAFQSSKQVFNFNLTIDPLSSFSDVADLNMQDWVRGADASGWLRCVSSDCLTRHASHRSQQTVSRSSISHTRCWSL